VNAEKEKEGRMVGWYDGWLVGGGKGDWSQSGN